MAISSVTLLYDAQLPDAPFDEFRTLVQSPGLDLRISSSVREPQAGIEWMLPTAAVLFLGKSYFDGFLKEMGKDHYQALKRGIERLWAALVSSDRDIVVRIVSTAGKVEPDSPVSRLFSIYSETRHGGRVKFLFDEGLNRDQFMNAIEATLIALEEYHSDNPHSLIFRSIAHSNVPRHLYLLRFDQESEKLQLVDPFRAQPD